MYPEINLGIIYKNGKIINHRSLLKVCLNPLLRLAGIEIVSVFQNNEFKRIVLQKCVPRPLIWSWDYDLTDCQVVKKRTIF